ncbi:hypothetical protein BY996DRAFT_6486864 [Phakopsora pachyrhizi]|uniref:Uncharacterized protein n=1 Tax=Phakopsora pachyrhizi TaxID=170000 RepID=A0AAV0BAB6_PHAPC|nr:hypothetical protein BY996DRAFT_6486864 [Phakopsora pachyrhizi]CAH7682687.1 hypothetical protein PPACK8108_LOCUS15757 [Phakopsora pachyrhizi]
MTVLVVEDTSGVICVDGLVVSKEAQTDRLDYDLSRWEPEEYEYLKKLQISKSEFGNKPSKGYDQTPRKRKSRWRLYQFEVIWIDIPKAYPATNSEDQRE